MIRRTGVNALGDRSSQTRCCEVRFDKYLPRLVSWNQLLLVEGLVMGDHFCMLSNYLDIQVLLVQHDPQTTVCSRLSGNHCPHG
jgi:hypothetical protein